MNDSAADGARREGRRWRTILRQVAGWAPDVREEDVTRFDPTEDLRRRSGWWGHHIGSPRLLDVVAFGVALADAEERAWSESDPTVATRAYADRRFLFGDRIVHWVVPLTFTRASGAALRGELLALGDTLRPAPALTGSEGLHPPGEDAYGPTTRPLSIELEPPQVWLRLAAAHPGTARLWLDLAARAGP